MNTSGNSRSNQYHFNSITVFQFFPRWDSWVPETLPLGGRQGILGPQKLQVGNNIQNLFLIFSK